MADPVKQRIIEKIRRLFLKKEPLNLTAVKRRHPELLDRVYAVRPFWGWKRALADAGVDYTKVRVELQDHCMCLICGAEAGILTAHLRGSHQMTPAEYREEFPEAEVMAETVRAARIRAKAASPHWEPVWSWEYVLDRVWEFHQRGWSLNCVEIQRRERPLFSFIWFHGREWDQVLQALGLDPDGIRKQAVGEHLNKADVVRGLKRRFRKGKSVAEAAVGRDDLRLENAARRRFGRYSDALRAAGFDPKHVRLRRPAYGAEDFENLREEMLRVASMHGRARAEAARALKRKYSSAVYNRLGNWGKACRKFGIPCEALAVYSYASRRDVTEALRKWASVPGASYKKICREDRPLTHAVYRFFGSWPAATKAVGVSFARKRREQYRSAPAGNVTRPT